ncbi:MAG: putative quinol monooxygenase [Povalibacter sp.]|jgi:quinol monooxygenase YgiN
MKNIAGLDRRTFIVIAASALTHRAVAGSKDMYGLIGKMIATPGQRDVLISILLEGIHSMPGCLSYVVAKDPVETDAIWITEVWDSEESHRASLSLPEVRQAIAKAKPMIANFALSQPIEPVGGHGLSG